MDNIEKISSNSLSTEFLLEHWHRLSGLIDYHVLTAGKYINERERVEKIISERIGGCDESRRIQLESFIRTNSK